MKIVFTGPESSGKTTLANLTSRKFGIALVQEIARDYIPTLKSTYTKDDVYTIAKLQVNEEQLQYSKNINICCDTDLLTIVIWINDKFGYFDQTMFDTWLVMQSDVLFLCKPDFPWEFDQLRENPYDRDRIFEMYEEILTKNMIPYIVLEGSLDDRMSIIKDQLNTLNFLP